MNLSFATTHYRGGSQMRWNTLWEQQARTSLQNYPRTLFATGAPMQQGGGRAHLRKWLQDVADTRYASRRHVQLAVYSMQTGLDNTSACYTTKYCLNSLPLVEDEHLRAWVVEHVLEFMLLRYHHWKGRGGPVLKRRVIQLFDEHRSALTGSTLYTRHLVAMILAQRGDASAVSAAQEAVALRGSDEPFDSNTRALHFAVRIRSSNNMAEALSFLQEWVEYVRTLDVHDLCEDERCFMYLPLDAVFYSLLEFRDASTTEMLLTDPALLHPLMLTSTHRQMALQVYSACTNFNMMHSLWLRYADSASPEEWSNYVNCCICIGTPEAIQSGLVACNGNVPFEHNKPTYTKVMRGWLDGPQEEPLKRHDNCAFLQNDERTAFLFNRSSRSSKVLVESSDVALLSLQAALR